MEIIRSLFLDIFSIISYKIVDNSIEVLLSTIKSSVCCPLCGKETNKYHSSYSRVMMDLPFVDKTIKVVIIDEMRARNFSETLNLKPLGIVGILRL